VSDSTHGLIPEIVADPISDELVLFLINAVYFKGTWTTQLDPADTRDGDFTTLGGATVSVPLMHLHGDLAVQETAEYQAVDLGYSSGSYRMAVILPKPGVDVDDLAAGLDPAAWAALAGGFQEQESDLALPRLELRYETSLSAPLRTLGMEMAFTGTADFTGIAPGDLFISDVKHKTFLRVDEEGTEAAAVTSVEFGTTSIPEYFTMIVNRPYLIVIHDVHSQSMLFMGRIGNPAAE
jgi:serpin B